ncbi:hypothetical protein PRELSG_1146400 [Plasmodium relictum]|uniref:Fam-j protein n=1 Tax=Plasmodium relictum TaxID=85471 RepID=A0A1J1H891_PLARL|nr:hypothetical protein PRELSG_1146400 [Plasmodium relictum]CRH01115.1 hypothetical protein PRELSG_1146400 [Plasmodium relictum]
MDMILKFRGNFSILLIMDLMILPFYLIPIKNIYQIIKKNFMCKFIFLFFLFLSLTNICITQDPQQDEPIDLSMRKYVYSNCNEKKKSIISSSTHRYNGKEDNNFYFPTNKCNLIQDEGKSISNNVASTEIKEKELYHDLNNASSNSENTYFDSNTFFDKENLSFDLENTLPDLNKVTSGLESISVDIQNISADLENVPFDLENLLDNLENESYALEKEPADLGNLLDNLENEPYDPEKATDHFGKSSLDLEKLLYNLENSSDDLEKTLTYSNKESVDLENLLDNLENKPYDLEKAAYHFDKSPFDLEKTLTDSKTVPFDQKMERASMENVPINLENTPLYLDNLSFDLKSLPKDLEDLSYDKVNNPSDLDKFIVDLEKESLDSFIKLYGLDNDDEKQIINNTLKRKSEDSIQSNAKRKKIADKEYSNENNTTIENNINRKHYGKNRLNFTTKEYQNLELYIKNFIVKIFPIKLSHISDTVNPLLQEIWDYIKNTHNEFRNMFITDVHSLKNLINDQIKNVDLNSQRRMKKYYDSLYMNKRESKKSSYAYMKAFKHEITYNLTAEKKIYLSIKEFLKKFEHFFPDFEKFKGTANVLSHWASNLVGNKLFLHPRTLQAEDNLDAFLNTMLNIDELIKSFEISCEEGKEFNDDTKSSRIKRSLGDLMVKVNNMLQHNLRGCLRYLKYLNLPNKEEKILTEYVFYILSEESTAHKKYLKDHIAYSYNEKILKKLEDFLLLESKNILKNQKKSSEIFNISLHEKYLGNKSLDHLVIDSTISKVLSNIYKHFLQLLKLVYFKEHLSWVIDIVDSMKIMKLQEMRSITCNAMNKKGHLTNSIENMKTQFKSIKTDLDYCILFNSLQKNINEGNEKIMKAYSNFKDIIFIFQSAGRILYEHMNEKTTSQNKDKTIKMENVLFALFYINQIITDRTIEEI